MCNIWVAELDVGNALYNHGRVKNFQFNCKEFAELFLFLIVRIRSWGKVVIFRCGEI